MINTAIAQISVRANIGYDLQRPIYAAYPSADQAPVNNDGDDYYYLPDLGVYYNVTDQDYVYFDGNEWVTSEYLPGQYHDYDWRNAARFEIRAAQPYLHDDFYRSKYAGNRFEGWARVNNNDRYNGGYASDGYRTNTRNDDNDRSRYNQPVQYSSNNDRHFDGNRGAYQQPAQQRGNYNQAADNRGQDFNRQAVQHNRNNNQGFDNRGSYIANHQNDQNHGNDNRGGNAQFGQNNRQNEGSNHRMEKF